MLIPDEMIITLQSSEKFVDLSCPAVLVVVRAVPHLNPPGVVTPLSPTDDAVAPELTAKHSPCQQMFSDSKTLSPSEHI